MALYTINLNKFEIEEPSKVIGKESYTLQALVATYFILNCDKGEFSTNTGIKDSVLPN